MEVHNAITTRGNANHAMKALTTANTITAIQIALTGWAAVMVIAILIMERIVIHAHLIVLRATVQMETARHKPDTGKTARGVLTAVPDANITQIGN